MSCTVHVVADDVVHVVLVTCFMPVLLVQLHCLVV